VKTVFARVGLAFAIFYAS